MPTLTVRNVSKRFGALQALSSVSATFEAGEIHALLGENGAGKSTLMAVVAGFLTPDAGDIRLDGTGIPIGQAHDCKRIGIEMIHQHFTLVPEFTVAENLALARLDTLACSANTQLMAQPALDVGKSLGWLLDPSARVRNLSVGTQQRLEILKALGGSARVLIFDEPTAVLTPDEVYELFRVLRRLKAEGKIVILIAHKLSEVLEIADCVTVLRLGKVVATAARQEVDASTLAQWMVGDMPEPAQHAVSAGSVEGFRADSVTVLGDRGEVAVDGLSFEIRQGEVLGIGGVDGNGQVELAECLAQVRKPKHGVLLWQGRPFAADSPRLGYVPQDRQTDGLALGMTIQENLLVSGLDRAELFRGPFLKAKAATAWAAGLMDRYSVKASGPGETAEGLSGGNQQKVVVSRILDSGPSFLVVVNPSRGLDIRATQFVHEMILAARARGAAIALITTDLEELFLLSDRTTFLSRGRYVDDLGPAGVVGGVD